MAAIFKSSSMVPPHGENTNSRESSRIVTIFMGVHSVRWEGGARVAVGFF